MTLADDDAHRTGETRWTPPSHATRPRQDAAAHHHDRGCGCGAPVINTVLFAIYHFFMPWRYPAIILGFLPITWMAWRERSVYVSIAAHVTINMITVLLILGAVLAAGN